MDYVAMFRSLTPEQVDFILSWDAAKAKMLPSLHAMGILKDDFSPGCNAAVIRAIAERGATGPAQVPA